MGIRKIKNIYRIICFMAAVCFIMALYDPNLARADEKAIVSEESDDEVEPDGGIEKAGTEYTYGGLRYLIDAEKGSAIVTGSVKASLKTLIVPDAILFEGAFISVTGISEYAFEGSKLTSAIIGENVTEIGEGAFAFSSKLKKVTIPKNCKIIDNAAFFMCNKLSKISLNKKAALKTIGEGAFAGTAITSFVIPESVVYIGDAAFGECEALKTFTIGKKVKSIGTGLLTGCLSLETVKISGGNKNFSVEENIIYSKDFKELISGAAAVGELKIKDGTESLLIRSFEDNEKLISVEIPESVSYIGECAFLNCMSLKNVIICGGTKEMGNNVFYGCDNLELIRIIRQQITEG